MWRSAEIQAKDVTEIFEAMGFSGLRTVRIWLET